MSSMSNDTALSHRPADLLHQLLLFDTTNPPGNERECITYINTLLVQAGFQTRILADGSNRPNLVARFKGRGEAPPLLLQGHIDVVTTQRQHWRYPPFAGTIAEDYIWGRGTLDMKGGVAMMIAALLRAKAEGTELPGDVLLTILSDEEAGGEHGANFLVREHASLFQDIRYALGEFGGFNVHIAGKSFYPIQVLEKQICWLKATVRGPGGHASMPMHGGATAKLGRLLLHLDEQRLPVHIHPIVQQMLETIANVVPDTASAHFRRLLDPAQTDAALDATDLHRQLFDPILHNTVNATIIHGGEQINVIPSEIVLELDGRMLPGYGLETMLHELRLVIGNEVELEVVRLNEGQVEPNMGLYDTLADVLRELDPGCTPLPFLMPVVTDGRHFARLGIQTYGFLPVKLPPDFNFLQTIHAADERIPLAAMESGTQAIFLALQRNHA